MYKYRLVSAWLLLLTLLTGCHSGVSGLYRDGFPGTASWSILPFVNFSQSEGVSPQVERMVAVLLPAAGVDNPRLYQGSVPITFSSRTEEVGRLQDGRSWADTEGAGFAVGGEIQDWFIDEGGHAQVSISLHVNDTRSGKTLWSVSGSSEGLAGESIHEVCRSLITDLLESLPVNRRQ